MRSLSTELAYPRDQRSRSSESRLRSRSPPDATQTAAATTPARHRQPGGIASPSAAGNATAAGRGGNANLSAPPKRRGAPHPSPKSVGSPFGDLQYHGHRARGSTVTSDPGKPGAIER